jgi:lysophospholipase L1-like esterase
MSITFWDNFENDALNAIAPGWVNGTGANFTVTTNTPVSGSHAFGEAAFTSGHTAVYTGAPAAADQVCQLTQVVQLDASGHGANIGPSLRTDSAATTTGYYFLPEFHGGAILVYKRVAGTFTNVANIATGITWTNGMVAIIKAQVQGTTLGCKVWAGGTAEPSSWTGTLTDASISTAGYAGLYTGSNAGANGATTSSFDDFFLGSAGTTFPTTVVTGLTGNLYKSQFNWAMSSTTGQLTTINPGAEIDLDFASATQVCLAVNVSAFASAGYPAASYPKIKYSISGGPMQTYQLQSTDNVLQLGGSLTGSNSLQLWLMGLDPYGGNPGGTPLTTKWSGANSLVIRGILLDYGATTSPQAAASKTWLAYGDSITEGEWQLGNSNVLANAVAYGDATTSHIAFVSGAMGAQLSNVSFGGQAWAGTFDGDVPQISSTYNFLYNGVSRSFASPPNYVSVNLGPNGSGLASSTILTSFLASLRESVGSSAQILVLVPFGGQARANIEAGFAAYLSANPTDNAKLIDLNDARFAGTFGTPAEFLSDGLHPTQMGQAMAAAELVHAIQTALGSTGGGNGGATGTSRSVSGGLVGL